MKTDIQNQDKNEAGRTEERSQDSRTKIFPAYEVWEEKDSIHLRLEMPGLTRDDVEITVENDQLSISGSRPDWTVNGTTLFCERRVGDYYRVFTVDKTVNTDAISATMKNGVLDLTLGLAKEAKPRRIEIKTT